jgi:hypothetical protein
MEKSIEDVNEIVRFYDGSSNPIGNCYSKEEFKKMLEPYIEIKEIYYHLFPATAFPFRDPKYLH